MGKVFNKHNSLRVALLFAFVGAFIIVFSLFVPAFNDWSLDKSNINANLASQYGGFIGGVAGALFGLVSAILLFQNFYSQEKSAAKQSFESNFFEMIRLHRDNVLEMSHQVPYYEEAFFESGRRVFLSMHAQYQDISDIIRELIGDDPKNEKLVADISYIFFFFGAGFDSWKMVEPYFEKYKLLDEIAGIRERLLNQRAKYNKDVVRFGGHQSRLGHYYRHLFQAVKYVDRNNDLTDKEKYDYVRLLRAQLSTTEQAIFFYNSISQLGKEWEADKYITKYQLIKNLPLNFVAPLVPKNYYPGIVFEYEEVE